MAEQFTSLSDDHAAFIARQHMFFCASAAVGARINLTPRSTELLRITGPNEALFLDLVGSSNETAAHMIADGRLTFMFCAVAGPPMIMRLYGTGRTIHRGTDEYQSLIAEHFTQEPVNARQIFVLDFDLVQTSCGYGVPMFEFTRERPSLKNWAKSKTPDEIEAYKRKKNLVSMDGLPTGLKPDDLA
ncbi:pyridoxamine 5'-phosphate oxidase [Pacificibacter marinus]|uniref:Pyridoxamine 5'-phosphate oxidase n=1 Tax=Pacificibacter marinus TaxID=658057 RepID=A0A1Y5S948_9RHOB|nr:pyridoxamine 5'-phosphate oxidase [Pacificibacter marinus]SEL38452.1 hypothetical protein SAMN04488032_12213 [Pacificibacter marinus]SLN32550.1 hypothetical protein PAM7971_01310 [Pacificibacter marinus]